MRFLFRWLGKRLFNLVFRWLVLGTLSRLATRWLRRTSVAKARTELEAAAQERLPTPVNRALAALPESAKAAGGSAIVAGQVGRSVVSGTRRARQLAGIPRRARARLGGRSPRAVADRIADEFADETEQRTRKLRSQYLAATEGPDAATDALLDALLDARPVDPDTRSTEPVDPHALVPKPVRSGRRRHRRRRSAPPVNRVSRTYHKPRRPWD